MSYNNSGIPTDAFRGLRALNTQSYTESNIKLGLEHEGSTLLTVSGNAENDTIFLTGNTTVLLKSRTIGYSGRGVTAEIYIAPTYSGGTLATYQNPNTLNPVVGLSQIIVGTTVTADGTLAFAPVHLLGSTGQNTKGLAGADIGQEKVLAPNTAYLFRLTNLDSRTEQISSYLSWYEGPLDLPIP